MTGCSIVPFSVDPHYSGVYFLLGQERKGNWRGSNEWCDFGGGKKRDESSEACAAREFQEETLGVVKLYDQERVPRDSEEILVDMLAGERYCMRIEYKQGRYTYRTYVKQVPWQPECAMVFAQTRETLLALRRAPAAAPMAAFLHPATFNITEDRATARVDEAFLEKRKLKYFSVCDLMAALAHPKRHLCDRVPIRDTFAQRITMILRQFRQERVDYAMLPLVREAAVRKPTKKSWSTVKRRGKHEYNPDHELRHCTPAEEDGGGRTVRAPHAPPSRGLGTGGARRADLQDPERPRRVPDAGVLPDERQGGKTL